MATAGDGVLYYASIISDENFHLRADPKAAKEVQDKPDIWFQTTWRGLVLDRPRAATSPNPKDACEFRWRNHGGFVFFSVIARCDLTEREDCHTMRIF